MGGFAHDASPFFLPSRVGLSAKKLCGGADPILYRGRPCRSWVIYYTCMIASVSGTIQAKGDRFLIVVAAKDKEDPAQDKRGEGEKQLLLRCGKEDRPAKCLFYI